MSFFRPEATRLVLRWAETAVWGAITAAGVLWLALDSGLAGPARWIGAAVLLALGLWLVRAAAITALAGGEVDAPGVVEIDERRIAYLGPEAGGVASLEEIHTIEIWAPAPEYWRYGAEWIFRWSESEPALVVPSTAKGAAALIDACAALPGFAPSRAVAALGAPKGSRITIWRRDDKPRAPALETSRARGKS